MNEQEIKETTGESSSMEEKVPAPEFKEEAKMTIGVKLAIGLGVGCLVILIGGGIVSYFLVKKTAETIGDIKDATPFERFEKSLQDMPEASDIFENNEEESEEIKVEINKPATDGQVEVVVNSIERFEEYEGQKPYKGNQYLFVNVTLENETNEEITVYTSNFNVRDLKYNKYYTAYLEKDTIQDGISAWQFIPKDKKITGVIVFEINKLAAGMTMEYKGQKTLIFDLGE